MLTPEQLSRLEIVSQEGTFPFDGDQECFKLFAEAERIRSAYQFDPLFAVNCSIVDPLPHQVEAVYRYLLPLPQIRFLLADDTGAGKTIMTGLLLKEMLMRGLIERILIVTPGGLTKQWQEDELGIKFNLPFKLVNRATFDADPNIFRSTDRLVTSIDFLRGDDVQTVLADSRWDLVVVDEAHKLSAFDYGTKKYVSQRYKAVEMLASRCDHLLLLTATPHRGRKDTFKNLLQLLDEDIFSSDTLVTERIGQFEAGGLNKFFIRRLKEDMRDWQGNPLFKQRYTKTVGYELSPAEKNLYDRVTKYLSEKKEEAKEAKNIHVTLALTVMQRRLASSLFAIQKTLHGRYRALKGLLDELQHNPGLLNQRLKADLMEVDSPDDLDELTDEERQTLDNILADPRKFRLFTTAASYQEVKEEMLEVKKLVDLADELVQAGQEERKYEELNTLLKREKVFDKEEKLVLFTEHKDTLDYLEQKLRNAGYGVATIHGGKSVDERRAAQYAFAGADTQILIATDAAGEGINLQFCRLLINWDIPWNPNRLEQRMGRIHRYGQQRDVLVCNLVAQNTREGAVLQRLLSKLDIIREQMGDDRVYDVIQDVLADVPLDAITNSVLHGQATAFDTWLAQSDTSLQQAVATAIQEQKDRLAHSTVSYADARRLKEHSDEQRLQPIYIKLFFEKAFARLGGTVQEIAPQIFKLTHLPTSVVQVLKNSYNLSADVVQLSVCFDKGVFLAYQQQLPAMGAANPGRVHYINPGNAVFDALVQVVRQQFREDMLKGTVLISPDDTDEQLVFFVKSQVVDNRSGPRSASHGDEGSVADERLVLIVQQGNDFSITSPAKLLDLHPPLTFAQTPQPPTAVDLTAVEDWTWTHVTEPQWQQTEARVADDAAGRRAYLEQAFDNLLMDLQQEINTLQDKLFHPKADEARIQEKINRKEQQVQEVRVKQQQRLARLDQQQQLSPRPPDVLGCAYVVPLSQVEYERHFGMKRDDTVEATAMHVAMEYEQANGRTPTDVSAQNRGYDIQSVDAQSFKRYIEVKGRAHSGPVMLSENEKNRLEQLGDQAWLYIVTHCASDAPQLHCFRNPAQTLRFDKLSKGVQYLLPEAEWRNLQS
ncbi:helicase-related protein [Rudanella lutea]|uniref:helicase-related protein n=1 Tax=Rudanella lutea TaxID=451374 RepID=UPI000369762A|nr:helicase-related protein [Rudanella lutea]